MRYLLIPLLALIAFTACQKQAKNGGSGDLKRYPIKGKVVSVDKANKKVKIDHEKISGFMDAMTMDFLSTRTGSGKNCRQAPRYTRNWSSIWAPMSRIGWRRSG
jgi:Cu/Ag efflux protein CusF